MEAGQGGSPGAGGELAPSEQVIEAVAAASGTDPTSLQPPLFDAVDPDALDALFTRQNGSDVQVEFNYCGYRVTVDAESGVSLADGDG